MSDTVGLTKDAGWEVGVRHTVAGARLDTVWRFVLGEGVPIWLGKTTLVLDKGAEYETDDGIRGRVISYSDTGRLRLTWQPEEWDHHSRLQVTVREAATGTTIAFHQEKLSGREERKIMLGHWKEVVARLDDALTAS